jgi:putative FmdB family regulatory protein
MEAACGHRPASDCVRKTRRVVVPTYEYRCDACEHQFEEFQSITAAPLKKCPACGKAKLRRLLGTGGGVIFRGSGFYQTDYRSESYKKAASAEKSGGSTASSDAAKTTASSGDSQSSAASSNRSGSGDKSSRAPKETASKDGGGKKTVK